MAATVDTVAQRCPSTAMVYLMHLCGVACYAAAPAKTEHLLVRRPRAAPLHAGVQREGIAQPFLGAGEPGGGRGVGTVRLSAEKSFVTSAGHADGYVVSTLAAGARRRPRAPSISCSAAMPAHRRRRVARAGPARQRQRTDDARRRRRSARSER